MKKLDRFLIRDMFVPMLIGTFAIVLMFQMNLLIYLYKELQLTNAPPLAVIQLLIYKTPNFLQMTLPIGVALATSLSISRLVRESELTAMRSAGVRIIRVIMPTILMGVFISLISWGVTEKIMPKSEKMFRQRISELGVFGMLAPVKSNQVIFVRNYAITVGSVTKSSNNSMELNDVMLVDRKGRGRVTLIMSPKGAYQNNNWVFKNPVVYDMRDSTLVTMESNGNPLRINEPFSVPQFFFQPAAEEQSSEELKEAIRMGREQRREVGGLEVSYFSKFSIPSACLVFAITGPAMAVAFGKRGPFIGTFMSLLCAILYFNLYIISTQILSKYSGMSPILSAWLPNILLAILGMYMIRRSE